MIQGPRKTHDENYDGPFEPMELPPTQNITRQGTRGAKSTRPTKKRLVMRFFGQRLSARNGLKRFPKLKLQLKRGQNIKDSTIEKRLREYYRKEGVAVEDLRSYDIEHVRERRLQNRVIQHYTINNTDENNTILE